MNIIARGAEAILYIQDGMLVKERISKGYRIKQLDDKIRIKRTKSEAKLLAKASVANTPKLRSFSHKDMKIVMDYLDGDLVKDKIDGFRTIRLKKVCTEIGSQIGKLHDNDIVHGDLTTSNMILMKDKVYMIDFGLGLISKRKEDKAVDLRLLRQALEAKHYNIASKAFSLILAGYKKEYKLGKDVVDRLRMKVDRRGRYKGKQDR